MFDTIAVTCYAFDCVFRFLSVFNTTSQTARCSPSLKTRKSQLLMNTTLLLLCCRVLWFKNLTHKLTWWLFSQPSLTFESLIWRDTGGRRRGCTCLSEHFEEGGRYPIHYIQILGSFIVFKSISGV